MAELSTAAHPRPEPAETDEVYYYAQLYGGNQQSSNRAWEIEEEGESKLFEIHQGGEGSPLATIKEEISLAEDAASSVEVNDDCVYVGVGKGESSADAVAWALRNADAATTTVYLIHVFPEVHHIPSPLGKLPKSQVSPEQVESYMAQERGKRRLLLQNFINHCSASKVKVETILIESDMAGKAILDLIPILNIRKLVLGTNKSNVKKLKHRKGNTNIADQVILNAPEGCEISIICQGQRVTTVDGGTIIISTGQSSPSPSPRLPDNINSNHKAMVDQLPAPASNSNNGAASESFACMCFKSPRVTS